MTKLVALHALVLTAAGTQLPENIPPQHVFEASDEETQFLAERQAVRGFVAAQDKNLPTFQRRTAAQAQIAAASDSTTQSQVDLTKLKKEDLVELAVKEGLQLKGDETVAQLRDAITARRNQAAGDDGLV